MISRRTMLAALPVAAIGGQLPGDRPGVRPVFGRARTLHPRDPVAVELARLYDALRAAHGPEAEARVAMEAHRGADDPSEGEGRARYWAEWDRLHDAADLARDPRSCAYQRLVSAVIRAHGGGVAGPDQYCRYGVAHWGVRVGSRVYTVCCDYDSECPDDESHPDDHGSVILSVIEL